MPGEGMATCEHCTEMEEQAFQRIVGGDTSGWIDIFFVSWDGFGGVVHECLRVVGM